MNKFLLSYSCDMDAFIVILDTGENVHANFHCGVSATLIFCYKFPSVA